MGVFLMTLLKLNDTTQGLIRMHLRTGILKVIGWMVGILILLTILLLGPADQRPYPKTGEYRWTMQKLKQIAEQPHGGTGDTLCAGWGKANIMPDYPVGIVGYKYRGLYEEVLDSSFVRAFVFDNGLRKAVILCYDLWIIHSRLSEAVKQTLKDNGLDFDLVYFSAGHTHSGMGGWAPGVLGEIIAGDYDPEVVSTICTATGKAVRAALNRQRKVQVGFDRYYAGDHIQNRLIKDGPTDPWIRVLKLQWENGETALWCTYSAHATILSRKDMGLSSDYPGALATFLEENDSLPVAMAAFSAGMVGSHKPRTAGLGRESMQSYGKLLGRHILDSMSNLSVGYTTTLATLELPVKLKTPHVRISREVRIRPWLVSGLYGEMKGNISALRLGDVALLGTSSELSGEFYPAIEAAAHRQGLNVIVTSFSGSYTGYVVPDCYQYRDHAETRELNWSGPESGDYLLSLIRNLLTVLGEDVKK